MGPLVVSKANSIAWPVEALVVEHLLREVRPPPIARRNIRATHA